MTRLQGLTSVLLGIGIVGAIVACQTSENVLCMDGTVETPNTGSGDAIICCKAGSIGIDGLCIEEEKAVVAEKVTTQTQSVTETIGIKVETPEATASAEEATPQAAEQVAEVTVEVSAAVVATPADNKSAEQSSTEPEQIAEQPAEPVAQQNTTQDGRMVQDGRIEEQEVTVDPNDFVYLTAPNGKGSAYCPQHANSLAWNGVQFKCCGKGLKSVTVSSRDDSICCPTEAMSARWVGKGVFDYECCPKGTVETKNEGTGDKHICCLPGQIARDGNCLIDGDVHKDGKTLMTALGNKGQAYCPENANSLAWDGKEFQCCGKGMKATAVPSRGTSICCPDKTKDARWVGKKWNDFECCPAGTVETKNEGTGDRYICCPEGNKALNGECLSVR